MKHFIITVLFLAFTDVVIGQARYFDERYISSVSFLNPVILNPGATGMEGDHQLLISYKNKWSSFPDAPKSFILSYDGPIAERLGLGFLLTTDSNGLETTKFQGSLAYQIPSYSNKLNVGITGEYINHGLSGESIVNPFIDQGDNVIQEALMGSSFFDVTVGAYGIYDDKITYGLALPGLVSSRLGGDGLDSLGHSIGYILNVGYKYGSSDSDVTLEPSLFVKNLNNVPFHVDVNVLGRFADDKLMGGVTYTIGADQKVGFLIGTTVNTLSFTYAYNTSRHQFQTYNNGSHELALTFTIPSLKRQDEKNMDAEIQMDNSPSSLINN